ncbi:MULTISPECIES: hypothetical protein [Natrialbaceae]|uniref:hypothetical protein n=1 Tax=Natrialbaceae TaxID=1644061 RepID=UPI00207D6540|nr:hypothetical protein [Natronococcus sp. CG52]
MESELNCPECETAIRSKDQLEEGHEVSELAFEDDGISLYGNRNLFLCKNCKRPLGVDR